MKKELKRSYGYRKKMENTFCILSSFNAKLFLKTRTRKDTSASIQNILKEMLAKL